MSETPKSPFDWFSSLSKFEYRSHFPPKKPPSAVVDKPRNSAATAAATYDYQKPDSVRFPKSELAVATVEAEADVSGKTSNPVVIWQVYALGGFLILSWAWERWKERRSQRRPNEEDEHEEENEDSEDT